MKLKPEVLAEARAALFRTSSAGSTGRNTGHANKNTEKGKTSWEKQKKASSQEYVVTISAPWGGTRRYAVGASGMSLAVSRAVQRDPRLAAVEDGELALIGVKRSNQTFDPPLQKHEVRLLFDTER